MSNFVSLKVRCPLYPERVADYMNLSEEYQLKFSHYLVAITGNIFKLKNAYVGFIGIEPNSQWNWTIGTLDGERLGKFESLEAVVDYLEQANEVAV